MKKPVVIGSIFLVASLIAIYVSYRRSAPQDHPSIAHPDSAAPVVSDSSHDSTTTYASGDGSPNSRIINADKPTVTLHDGRKVTGDVQKILVARRSIAESHPKLQELVKAGDDSAAMQMFLDLFACWIAPDQKIALENEAAIAVDEESAKAIIRQITDKEALCNGVDSSMLETRFEYLALAARMGNIDAKIAFPGMMSSKYETSVDMFVNSEEISKIKQESLRHLLDASKTGNRNALGQLSFIYWRGTHGKVDRVKGYAYLLATARLGASRLPQNQLDIWRPELNADQLLQAQNIADQIVASCCHPKP